MPFNSFKPYAIFAAAAAGLLHAPGLAQSSDTLASATDVGIAEMMEMLRSEGIDIDARIAKARENCREKVVSEAQEATPEEIEQDVEDCAIVEKNIIYSRAINEMNAKRVDNFNATKAAHEAQVAEAQRKQREYDLEMQKHRAELAESQRQQDQYNREVEAHEQQLAELAAGSKGSDRNTKTAVTSPSQPSQQQEVLAANTPRDEPRPEVVAQPPAQTPAQVPALARAEIPAPRQTAVNQPVRNAPALSRSTGPAPAQGRVLSQSLNPNDQGAVELDIMEATGPRIALIIGNEQYTGAMGSLANPVNDAVLIGATLRSLGFDVEILTNADQKEMKKAVRRLGDRLLAAGENSTGLFYYAGHGVQSGGNNFLIPVGAEIEAESDLELEAVKTDGILAQMEEAYVSTRIVILDACRNMPLRRRTRDGTRGLARMETPNGSFVAYSTSPGNTASDGGGIHSPFAEALASQMLVPNRPIEVTFREVRREVVERTNGDQVPWDSSSLLDTFNFATTQ
jgi:Caspase domain